MIGALSMQASAFPGCLAITVYVFAASGEIYNNILIFGEGFDLPTAMRQQATGRKSQVASRTRSSDILR
jgi:hypothetical protein